MQILCVTDQVTGVTYLDNIMYVVCDRSSTILLYNMDRCSPLDTVTNIEGVINADEVINVDGMGNPRDIAVCRDDRQLYVREIDGRCIWIVSADDHSYMKWLPNESTTDTDHVYKMSLTSDHILLTSSPPPHLRQYSKTDRQLLRVIPLPDHVWLLHHAVETTRQTFVVGYAGTPQDKRQGAVSELFRFCRSCEWIQFTQL